MNAQLKAVLGKYRKQERDILELRKLQTRMRDLKNPDAKLLKMIEDEIANLQKETLVP